MKWREGGPLAPFMPAIDLRSVNIDLARLGKARLDWRLTLRDNRKVKIPNGHQHLTVTLNNVLGESALTVVIHKATLMLFVSTVERAVSLAYVKFLTLIAFKPVNKKTAVTRQIIGKKSTNFTVLMFAAVRIIFIFTGQGLFQTLRFIDHLNIKVIFLNKFPDSTAETITNKVHLQTILRPIPIAPGSV